MAKVLVVDDDTFVVQVIAGALRNAGHEVECAYDGEAGEEAFDATPFDAVICDMLMPRQEGLETIRHMRQTRPNTAIVAISGGLGAADIDILNVARQLGAHATLKKPFQIPELVGTVDQALLNAQTVNPPNKARA